MTRHVRIVQPVDPSIEPEALELADRMLEVEMNRDRLMLTFKAIGLSLQEWIDEFTAAIAAMAAGFNWTDVPTIPAERC